MTQSNPKSEIINLKLVLMSCCAPCSAGAIVQLRAIVGAKNHPPKSTILSGPGNYLPLQDGDLVKISDFVVLFYNPNIFPELEYQKRLAEQIRYCDQLGVKYVVGVPACAGMTNYDAAHQEWRNCVRGLEDEPEQGARCAACFRHRFAYGAEWARRHGYNAIASVFGVSRWKNQSQVDAAAESVVGAGSARPISGAIPAPLRYIPIAWDESARVAKNKKACFYRQKYCGCEFSIRET
ncbi:MAG: epoxyqueuosine reductase QueH [Proteobacteria bacterium]|nr:epoxyqueuosine reductase QueH [Pseudomonadota bacterium]